MTDQVAGRSIKARLAQITDPQGDAEFARVLSDIELVGWQMIECADLLMRNVYEGIETVEVSNQADDLYEAARRLVGRTDNN